MVESGRESIERSVILRTYINACGNEKILSVVAMPVPEVSKIKHLTCE
jgi:hypothetical protein